MAGSAPDSRIAVDQRLARIVARQLARTPVTPNALTVLSMAMGLSAGALLAHGMPAAHWGAGLFMIAAWMDHLDGEVARQTGRTSAFGHYLDHAAAMINYIAVFVGAGIGLSDSWLGAWAIPSGVSAGVSIAAIFTVRMWMERRYGMDSVEQTVHGGFEIEDTLYVIGPVTWLGLLPPFVAAAGVGTPLFLVWVAWDAWRRGRTGPEGA